MTVTEAVAVKPNLLVRLEQGSTLKLLIQKPTPALTQTLSATLGNVFGETVRGDRFYGGSAGAPDTFYVTDARIVPGRALPLQIAQMLLALNNDFLLDVPAEWLKRNPPAAAR